MNDETTKEIEDLSTLACSTDEVARKRALMAMLARVVGRADTHSATDPLSALHEDMDRANVPLKGWPLEDRVQALWEERDTHKANAEYAWKEAATYRAVIGHLWARVPFRLADDFRREDIVGAVEALVSENSAHETNAATLARDLTEARAEVERIRSRAGSPEKAARVMTRAEYTDALHAWQEAPTYRESFEALESRGLLSVRLPIEE